MEWLSGVKQQVIKAESRVVISGLLLVPSVSEGRNMKMKQWNARLKS